MWYLKKAEYKTYIEDDLDAVYTQICKRETDKQEIHRDISTGYSGLWADGGPPKSGRVPAARSPSEIWGRNYGPIPKCTDRKGCHGQDPASPERERGLGGGTLPLCLGGCHQGNKSLHCGETDASYTQCYHLASSSLPSLPLSLPSPSFF